MAKNLALQSHGATGQARRLAERLGDLATEADAHAWDAADRVIAREQALAALATLSANDAEAIALTLWHGLEPADAARVAGCSRPTFLVRLHRARRRLAHALDAPSGREATEARSEQRAAYPPAPPVTTEQP